VDDAHLHVDVAGGRYRIHLTNCSARLAQATSAQRQWLEISPDGYGIHWPSLDEDLAITPLLEQAEPEPTVTDNVAT
jgi:hypothetical protein